MIGPYKVPQLRNRPGYVARSSPNVMRDMQRVATKCRTCQSVRACKICFVSKCSSSPTEELSYSVHYMSIGQFEHTARTLSPHNKRALLQCQELGRGGEVNQDCSAVRMQTHMWAGLTKERQNSDTNSSDAFLYTSLGEKRHDK
jgi:hypothetical protein